MLGSNVAFESLLSLSAIALFILYAGEGRLAAAGGVVTGCGVQAGKRAGRQAGRQANRQSGRWAGGQPGRRVDG